MVRITKREINCERCRKSFIAFSNSRKYCDLCIKELDREHALNYAKNHREEAKKRANKWYLDNLDRAKVRTKEYSLKNADKLKAKNKEYYLKNKKEFRERSNAWISKNKERYLEYSREKARKLRQKYPEKVFARNKARTIRVKECEICKSKENLQKHHQDYSKPLEIQILCRNCHLKIHKK